MNDCYDVNSFSKELFLQHYSFLIRGIYSRLFPSRGQPCILEKTEAPFINDTPFIIDTTFNIYHSLRSLEQLIQ